MEIKIQIRGRVYCFCIGYKTRWFESMYLFHLEEEFYDEHKNVIWANVLFKWWKQNTKKGEVTS